MHDANANDLPRRGAMTHLSKALKAVMWRMLSAIADSIAVPCGLFVALWLHADGLGAISTAQDLPFFLLAAMCGGAVASFSLRNGHVSDTGGANLSVGARLILSSFVVAVLLLGFAALQLPGSTELFVMFAMSFFILSIVLDTCLITVFSILCPQLEEGIATVQTSQNGSRGNDHHLLGRDAFAGDIDASKAYSGRVILVSGAGGSIGSELAQQLLESRPRKIVLFELNEGALYQVHQTMERAASGTNIEIAPVLGSVADERKVRATLRDHKVQVVLHAAAYKHVPLIECNALAGLHNNVEGTHTLATQSVLAGVERFVLISSDKAVRPINVMGASKRLCEMVVQDISARVTGCNHPVFSIVRFGNVLGSSGSVLPLFEDQVRRGGPVTVTHPDVARYFMTAEEAVHLVLQAGTMAMGGEVFVLEMGRPVNIETLARRVIQNAGLTVRDKDNPTGDIPLKYVGLRRGEKLREELTFNGAWAVTAHPRIFTAIEEELSEFEVANALRALRRALADEDEDGARENACRWVQGTGGDRDILSQMLDRPNTARRGFYPTTRSHPSERIEAGNP